MGSLHFKKEILKDEQGKQNEHRGIFQGTHLKGDSVRFWFCFLKHVISLFLLYTT